MSGSASVWDLQEFQDDVVHLREDGEMNGKAGTPVLCGGITGEPGQSVILLQNKPETQQHKPEHVKTNMNLHAGAGLWALV